MRNNLKIQDMKNEKRDQEIIQERLNEFVPYEAMFRGSQTENRLLKSEIKNLKEEIGALKSLQDENEFIKEENIRLREEIQELKNDKKYKLLEERIKGLLSKEENRKDEIQKKNEAILKRKEETVNLQKKISKQYVKISQLTALNILHESTIRSRDFRISELEDQLKNMVQKEIYIKGILETIIFMEDESERYKNLKLLYEALDNEKNNQSA